MLLLLLGGVGFEVMPGSLDNLVAFSMIKKVVDCSVTALSRSTEAPSILQERCTRETASKL